MKFIKSQVLQRIDLSKSNRYIMMLVALFILISCTKNAEDFDGELSTFSELPIIDVPFADGSNSETATIKYTGYPVYLKVPLGATRMYIDAVGAGGGASYTPAYGIFYSQRSAGGARVQASTYVSPTAGNGFTITIGGAGENAGLYTFKGGYNGGGGGTPYNNDILNNGGGGGGATDIRINQADLSQRILVAASGGGESFVHIPGYTVGARGNGGAGGGLVGGDAINKDDFGKITYPGVTGGTQTTGGLGGTLNKIPLTGKLGIGGEGFFGSGGGGGGGYYGGGGGFLSGGGGGSSYAHPNVFNDVVYTADYNGANPESVQTRPGAFKYVINPNNGYMVVTFTK
ncbi:MAG: glycine-rich protein [Alphaproteobacteria bacterium]|nr:glycine-rich protein [Alphaproteobacteria bacterium]